MGRAAVPALLSLLSACAASRAHHFLAERTDEHVFARPIAEVWPVAKTVLAERGFPPEETGGPYRLQTAILTPEGNLQETPKTSNAAMDVGRAGGARGGGRRPGAEAPTHSGGEVWRFVVNGTVVDDTHCRVRFTRYTRDSIESPESIGEPDAELEWSLISRVEPETAAAIRKDATAAGVTLP